MVISKTDFETWQTRELQDRQGIAWVTVFLGAFLFILFPCVAYWFDHLPFRFAWRDFLTLGIVAGYGIGKYRGAKSAIDSLLGHIQSEEFSRKLNRNKKDEVCDSFKA